MNRLVRSVVKFLVAIALVVLVLASCAGGEKDVEGGVKNVDLSIPIEIPVSLLPAMAVGVDACYVFVQPDGDSHFFGPLQKGEQVARIDQEGSWILIWIPKLRFSGWVRKEQVYLIKGKSSDKGSISTNYLTILNIVKKRVNIRKSATIRAPIIFKARQRQEFLLLDEKEGWYQIWLPNLEKKGWVAARMVVKQDKE